MTPEAKGLAGAVLCEDCLDVMRRLPDKCIDVLLTDPPYGIDADTDAAERAFRDIKRGAAYGNALAKAKVYEGGKGWDKAIPGKEYFDEMRRVSKVQIIWGGNYFAHLLPPSPCWFVWDKRDGDRHNSYSDFEMAWTSLKGASRIYRHLWMGMFKKRSWRGTEERWHPTQKPVELFMWCLKESGAVKGSLVLDCMAGSGTTAVAARRMGMEFALVERDADFAARCRKRIAALPVGVMDFL